MAEAPFQPSRSGPRRGPAGADPRPGWWARGYLRRSATSAGPTWKAFRHRLPLSRRRRSLRQTIRPRRPGIDRRPKHRPSILPRLMCPSRKRSSSPVPPPSRTVMHATPLRARRARLVAWRPTPWSTPRRHTIRPPSRRATSPPFRRSPRPRPGLHPSFRDQSRRSRPKRRRVRRRRAERLTTHRPRFPSRGCPRPGCRLPRRHLR